MNVPALKSAHKALESFERLRINPKKVQLILNRYQKSKLMSLESVERTLGLKPFWMLPNDYPTAVAALNQGVPIQEAKPYSKLAKSYRGLADALLQELASASSLQTGSESKRASLLSRWVPLRKAQ
jgi:Flp pilus assembly CpaE family ATPase